MTDNTSMIEHRVKMLESQVENLWSIIDHLRKTHCKSCQRTVDFGRLGVTSRPDELRAFAEKYLIPVDTTVRPGNNTGMIYIAIRNYLRKKK